MNHKTVYCNNCRHCFHSSKRGEWVCDNEESDNYDLECNFDDYCEDGEERSERNNRDY